MVIGYVKRTVADRNKTELITKLKIESQNPKTELQNLKPNHKTENRITKPKTESQNSKQNHRTQNRITKFKTESQNPKQNCKTQNRITKPKTESQNPKQNHKTQSRIAKPKTESQNPKQNHKTQNRITKPKTESQIPISPGFSEIHKAKQLLRKYTEREIKQCMQKKYLPHCFWIKFLCWKMYQPDRGGRGGGGKVLNFFKYMLYIS